MTATQQDKIDEANEKLNSYPLKYFVLGYVFNENGEMEYIGTACVNDEQVKRNRDKCVNSIVFKLEKV